MYKRTVADAGSAAQGATVQLVTLCVHSPCRCSFGVPPLHLDHPWSVKLFVGLDDVNGHVNARTWESIEITNHMVTFQVVPDLAGNLLSAAQLAPSVPSPTAADAS